MIHIEIGLNQKFNLYKVLLYSLFVMEQQDLSPVKILYQIYDKKNRIFRGNLDTTMRILYLVHPFHGPYEFDFHGNKLRLEFQILDEKRLYPYQDKDVFDYVFRLKIYGKDIDLVDEFIKESILHANQYLENDPLNETIYIWQYVESNESWEKYNEISKRNIKTIYLPDQQVEKIFEDVNSFLSPESKANYEKFGIPYHKTYCFYGPPGSGKTSLIHALCSSINKNICIYRFSPTTRDYDLSMAMKWLPKNSVFVLEDIDSIIKDRNDVKGAITFSGILNMLDGLSSMDCLITFITTNYFLELEDAIKRPGRIDYILEFSYMNKQQILRMLEIFYPLEIQDGEKIIKDLKNYKMTCTHFQKFLFSLYPKGQVHKNLSILINEHLKYYTIHENKLYV